MLNFYVSKGEISELSMFEESLKLESISSFFRFEEFALPEGNIGRPVLLFNL